MPSLEMTTPDDYTIAAHMFGGAHIGGAGSGETTHAAFTTNTEQYNVISKYIKLCNAVDIRENKLYNEFLQLDDCGEDLVGFQDLVLPVIVRVRGASPFCEATPCRVHNFVRPSAALLTSINWVDTAVNQYLMSRGQSTTYAMLNREDDSEGHLRHACAAVRLASRITRMTAVKYSDSGARRSAKLEFQVAVTALAQHVMRV
jgi:hypothetical protein